MIIQSVKPTGEPPVLSQVNCQCKELVTAQQGGAGIIVITQNFGNEVGRG